MRLRRLRTGRFTLERLAVQGSQGDFVQEFNVEANVACPSLVRRPPEPPTTSSTPSPVLQTA